MISGRIAPTWLRGPFKGHLNLHIKGSHLRYIQATHCFISLSLSLPYSALSLATRPSPSAILPPA